MRKRYLPLTALLALATLLPLTWRPAAAQQADIKAVLADEAKRIKAVEKVSPAVVAVFGRDAKGGGSGVLISKDGYALTNYHVTAPSGAVMKCGLADGVLYDAVLVGQDKVGDVALIKLLPKKAGEPFPFAPLGDSDKVREGDWSMAMGNPFLLATDFTPTVTFGMISGVHRYQYPAGTFLEYTDCIQIDTSINPGNSGGPLFNMDGELIGINGRGSFDKRGRVNSGVGYAISINQIKNFMGHLSAGLDCDHATLGAVVTTQTQGDGLGRMVVTNILDDTDVSRRGLDLDDELVSFDGRLITSVNQYRNILGVYPRGWRLPMEFRRAGVRKEILVRLMGIQRRVLEDPMKKVQPGVPPGGPPVVPVEPPESSPASKYYETKEGFANYYFNKIEKKRLVAEFRKHGDFTEVNGTWKLAGKIRLKQLNTPSDVTIEISEKAAADGKPTNTVLRMQIDAFPYELEPLRAGQDPAELRQPTGSGGFLSAVYMIRRLLTEGDKGFTECTHGGLAPVYPPPAKGTPEAWKKQKRMTEMLNARFGPYLAQLYFAQDDDKQVQVQKGQLRLVELRLGDNEDPCEVYLSQYQQVEGRMFPHFIQVRYGDNHYGTIELTEIKLAKAK